MKKRGHQYLIVTLATHKRFLPLCMECRHGLAMRILSVCLSVRLSVKRVLCDKTEGPDLYNTRKII